MPNFSVKCYPLLTSRKNKICLLPYKERFADTLQSDILLESDAKTHSVVKELTYSYIYECERSSYALNYKLCST